MNTKRIKIAALLVLALTPTTVATAANKFWKNSVGSGVWTNGNNWSATSAAGVDNAGVPVATDNVYIAPTDGAARTVNYDYAGPPITLDWVNVDLTGPGTNRTTFSMSSGNLANNGFIIADVGRATFNHSGGTFTANNPTFDGAVGYGFGSNGIYNLSGSGALSVAKDFYVGNTFSSNGTVNQTGGTSTIGRDLLMGVQAFSTGAYTLSGGTLTAGRDLVVGNSGLGTLTIQNNASAYVTNNLSINSASAVNLNGGTLRFDAIGGSGGVSRINYSTGTIRLGGERKFASDSVITTLYGTNATIPSGKRLTIESGTWINTTVRVDGGSLTCLGLPNVFLSNRYLYVGTSHGDGRLEITNGGTVSSPGTSVSGVYTGSVRVDGIGSSWNIAGDLYLGVNSSQPAALSIHDGALVFIENAGQLGSGTLSIGHQGTVTLDGGTIRFVNYDRASGGVASEGVFDFRAGTVQLAGDRSIGTDPAIVDILGDAPLLPVGKGLTVEGAATVLRTVTLDGGTFSAGQLVNAHLVDLNRGTLNLMNQAITIDSGGPLGSALDVNEDMTVNVTLGITNQGLVTGDGQIGGPFTNATSGELRAQAGRSLKLTGSTNTNAGQIKMLGGELEFTQNLTNIAGGFISGNGSLIVGAGLVNQGTMNFAGTANIDGAVTNAGGGKIISGGGGATIFYDDVTNNGEIRTSTNGFTVFFGGVSGSGTFTGTGTVNFEGDLSPGSSPAAINFAGDVVLGPEATLQIELGGTAAGTQYDQINVAGELTLGGTLDISLINGFIPSTGQTFDILNWGSLAGAFDAVVVPAVEGLLWNTSQLSSGILSVALPGDFNASGTVDAADYVVWRKTGSQDEYNTWRANFGRTAALGPVAGQPSSSVPEPTSVAIFLFAAVAFCIHPATRFAAHSGARYVIRHGRRH